MKSVIASHFKCFLPHSLVISVIFLLSTQPVRNCIEFQFGESQCNKRRNLQIDHKSSYGCSTDIEAQVETMTHMFQHDQYLLEIVRDLNGYFRLCEKSVRFQIEWTERREKNNNNCWNMCKSIVISYFYGRSFISQWHIGIGIFFSSMILFRLFFLPFFSRIVCGRCFRFVCVTLIRSHLFFLLCLLIKSVMLHFVVSEQWKFCCIPKFIVRILRKRRLTYENSHRNG